MDTTPNWLHDKRVQLAVKVTLGKTTLDVKATPVWPRGTKLTCLQRPEWTGTYEHPIFANMAEHYGKSVAEAAAAQGLFDA